MSDPENGVSRRTVLRGGVGVLGTALLGGVGSRLAYGNKHPHPHEHSLNYLDPKTYINRAEVHNHMDTRWGFGGKTQMMAHGKKRFLFNGGRVWDVTDAMRPELVNDNAYSGVQVQLAWNKVIRKWILMTGGSPPPTSSTPQAPNGKYDDPRLTDNSRSYAGLRGVRIHDTTDPSNIKLLSEWSCDQGDPGRDVQTGGGSHRCYYDGGRYAYLDAAPDNSFINMESGVRVYTNCMQIIDLSDPGQVKFVSNWWFPGQRAGELSAYRKWREYGDRSSFTASHGPFYVPRRVEDGGRYAYGAYGSFGVTVHDISNPAKPELISQWRPAYLPGAIPCHTADISMLDRDIVIGSAETLNPDCNEAFHDNYVLDVSDIQHPKQIAKFGRWVPPDDAPYDNFCDKRGRYGTHNPPHLKAPGKRHASFGAYAAFNAGFQFMDFSNPVQPKADGYFIPPSAGDLLRNGSYTRVGDGIFVEWDRRLIWAMADSGIYLLSHPSLGNPNFKPLPIAEWALDSINQR